jgi:imidazolonepropionase-like amidohydrolase
MRTALVDCSVLDGNVTVPQPGVTILLEDEVIVAVGGEREFPPDVNVQDMAGRVVMPGLIDCHIHFALWSLDLLGHQDTPLSYLSAQTYKAMSDALRAGCTSARDPGGLDAGFRDAVNDGLAPGPRLQTSITIISPINGICDGSKSLGVTVPYMPGMPSPECTGPVEARAKVREVVRAGADFIKIATTGGVSSRRRAPQQQLFTVEEVSAIVDEAHAWGRPVACHALGGPGLLMAVQCGVDSIEHGVWLDDETVREMAKRGTWYVPTLSTYELHARQGGPLQKARAAEIIMSHADSVRRAREAGVRIACGSDSGVYDFNFAFELELLVATGMSPGEAIAAATSRAAECLGWQAEVGALRPGMRADLLVLERDPTRDITVLQDASAVRVIKSGVPVGPPGLNGSLLNGPSSHQAED